VLVAPADQPVDDRPQLAAGLRQLVLRASASRGLGLAEDPAVDEVVQAVGQHGAGDAEVIGEVSEPADAVERVAHDQQGPALADDLGVWWYLLANSGPDYLTVLLAMLLSGAASGLTQAPLYAAVNTLPADRATTGSAVLNMSRQIGSAVGVALLVALLATSTPHELSEFRRGWVLMALSGWAAMVVVLVGLRRAREKAA
jgi:hypothetical protein